MKDHTTAAKLLVEKLGADYTDAAAVFTHEQQHELAQDKKEGRRQTAKRYKEITEETFDLLTGRWAREESCPLLADLPVMSPKEAAWMAHLIASRNRAALYLALLLYAKIGKPTARWAGHGRNICAICRKPWSADHQRCIGASDAVERIVELMSDKKWSADTLQKIADILRANGQEIKEPRA